jgi:hypothetical protein
MTKRAAAVDDSPVWIGSRHDCRQVMGLASKVAISSGALAENDTR